ncbi:hypothetical protein A9Q76_09335 [Arcobacter sp. 31_11_sub10_T18]|nr:hypothetical protein A9Q76_09335 [Arcobacter sp. 31_11_sub10_T18]
MFSEKNIPKLIILTPIFTIIILVIIILYSFIKTQKDYFQTESIQLEQDYIQKQKVVLQKEIEYIFNYIDYHKNLMLDNTKKNINIQMDAFTQLISKQKNNHQKYYEYVLQNANSNTDFIIYDISSEKLYKDPDVFFQKYQIDDIQTSLENQNQMFTLEDETNLYFYKYLKEEKIIVVLIKDIFYSLDDLKYSISRWVEYIRFGNNNYFWIHTNTNKLLAHPYRQEDINKDDTNLKDAKGTLFVQKFIKLAIKNHQGNFLEYFWPKPNQIESTQKLAFIKLYKEWNWIIGTGIYMDEIHQVISNKKKDLEKKIDTYIQNTIIIAFFLMVFISFLSIIISQQINNTFKRYQDKVHRKELKLKDLNQNLHVKIDLAIKEAKQKDRTMLRQSRLARMGEMLNMIAHQWRQPLSQLAGIMMEVETTIAFKKANDKFLLGATNDATKIIQFMSLTIEDFKNFFKPEKNKENFYVSKACKEAIGLIKESLINQHIVLNVEIIQDKQIKGYQREYSQVILNLLVNAKDALIMNHVKNANIILNIDIKDNISIVQVKDNAGGINKDHIESIFDPYFSTKKSQGTGLGLYMSKMIIETNMQGKLSVLNDEKGAVFTISI